MTGGGALYTGALLARSAAAAGVATASASRPTPALTIFLIRCPRSVRVSLAQSTVRRLDRAQSLSVPRAQHPQSTHRSVCRGRGKIKEWTKIGAGINFRLVGRGLAKCLTCLGDLRMWRMGNGPTNSAVHAED